MRRNNYLILSHSRSLPLAVGILLITALFIMFSAFSLIKPSVWETIDKDLMAKKLEEINLQFKSMPNYSIKVVHASFESFNTTLAHESSSGYFKKNKDAYHSFVMGVHTIQNNSCKLVVDSARHLIYVSDPSSSFESTFSQQDYNLLLKTCSALKKSQAGPQTLYRLEFEKTYPINAYEMSVGPEGLIEQITIYYNKEVKKEDATVTKPRLEVAISDWKKNIAFTKAEFDQRIYVIKKGNQYMLTEAYATKYKLLDQRVLTKQKN